MSLGVAGSREAATLAAPGVHPAPMTDEELRNTVMRRLGIRPTDPAYSDTFVQSQVDDYIEDAKAKVLLFLNRDSFDTSDVVIKELYRNDLVTDPADDGAFLPEPCLPDRARYISHVPNTDDPDLSDVTYRLGLDLEDPEVKPVVRFLITEAVESARYDPAFEAVQREVNSINSGGQSISYEKRPQSADAAGGQLTIGTLARFKRRSVGQSRTVDQTPLPYRSTPDGYR